MDSRACALRYHVSLCAGAAILSYLTQGTGSGPRAPLSSLDTATLLFFILLMPSARREAKVRFSVFSTICRKGFYDEGGRKPSFPSPEAAENMVERRLGSEPRVRWGSHPVLSSNTGAGPFYPLDQL